MVENSSEGWSTQLLSCLSDEETCWWGFWCCWLLNGRTLETFEIGSSFLSTCWFCIILFFSTLATLVSIARGSPGLALFFVSTFFCYIVWTRAVSRSKMRNKLLIVGSFVGDISTHCCCALCAVCQEARESQLLDSRSVDWCFGESLVSLEESHDLVFGRVSERESAPTMSVLTTISKTSKLILTLSGMIALLTFASLILSRNIQNVFVLLLVFVQPMLILYFFYWKTRRQYALLDYVIKTFACGFWFTTVQSMILELVLQGVIMMMLGPMLGLSGISSPPGQDDLPPDITTPPPDMGGPSRQSVLGYHNIVRLVGNDFLPLLLASKGPAIHPYMNTTNSSIGLSNSTLLLSPTSYPTSLASNPLQEKRAILKEHIVVVVIGLMLMSYVVAAGVEETMKHFIVRCCRFPSRLKSPHTVLVYMMAGALGFATAENIEYVFGTNTSPIPGTSLLVGELLILLVRILMPIHVICSVLQATSLSKVLMGIQQMSLLQILLPSIFLHGTFDFILFLMGAVEFIYESPSLIFEVTTLVVAGCVSIGGAVWAYKSFSLVQAAFDSGWQVMDQEEREENSHL